MKVWNAERIKGRRNLGGRKEQEKDRTPGASHPATKQVRE